MSAYLLSRLAFAALSCSCIIGTLNSPYATASEEGLCRAVNAHIPPLPENLSPITGDETLVSADQGSYFTHEALTPDVSNFKGDVLVQRKEQILRANSVTYDRAKGEFSADGEVVLWDEHYIARSPKARVQEGGLGEAVDAEYWLPERRAHGQAENISRDSPTDITLFKSSFSTCDPDNRVWNLRSRNTELDLAEGKGVARDVTFEFMGVPVFYTPYISFPLNDKRKSGLLAPSLGQSTTRGMEYIQPIYWNIAPNYDMTFAPRIMSKRGVELQTELRYLFNDSAGELHFNYMPHDNERDTNRHFLQVLHRTQFNSALRGEINYQEVSDRHYFEDLGTSLSLASITHLEQRGTLFYQGPWYYAMAQAQRFQTLDPDPAARPYERVPQLLFSTIVPDRNFQLNPNLLAEFVHFERKDDIMNASNPVGTRVDLKASLSYPMRKAAGFVVPRLSMRYTVYQLSNGVDDSQTEDISRALPTFSTDAGLFFERDTQFFGEAYQQTLEPRLFYLYTPYRDQSDIPLFDTGEYDFTLGQMFRESRFSGADRVNDANQIAMAISSRFIRRADAEESLRLSLGQVYYFDDRRVNVPGQIDQTQSQSNLIAEASLHFAKYYSLIESIQWDPDRERVEQNMLRLRYQPSSQRVLNASYRYRESTSMEQVDLSGYWMLNPRWSLVGRWNYSLEENKQLESFAGFEYQHCCWAVRFVARRYLKNLEGDYSTGALIQLELRGLTGAGRNTSTFLQQSVPGFNDEF